MFKYSCYIENSEEALQYLELLGYELAYPTKKREEWIQTRDQQAFITDGIYRNGIEINCVNNLLLFKALTAVRDDSDYMQEFTDALGDWHLNKNKELSRSFKFGINVHKATKEELIEKLKKEE